MTILILQRGWVVIGEMERDGPYVTLRNAAVIRRWGTDKGIGQLAIEGPRPETILDRCPSVRAHELTIVMEIPCDAKATAIWRSALAP